MNIKTLGFAAAAIAAVIGTAAPAAAAVSTYRANAHDARLITLTVYRPATLVVRGDTDTDLDFVVYNSRGYIVHEDNDYTDWTVTTLRPGTYTLRVSNLGDVYNAFTVALSE